MKLTSNAIARMMDLSYVKTFNTEKDIIELVQTAQKYRCLCVSVLQCYISEVVDMLKNDDDISVVGNISFPSGGDTTKLKVVQAKELINLGCDELDMVMNVGWLKSGKYDAVEDEIKQVVDAVSGKTLKVILEIGYLTDDEIKRACEICVRAGATFVKTGTGWSGTSTTLEKVKLIKSVVGDSIKIKASGGIRDVKSLAEMYKNGVTRFGVNMNSGVAILEECLAMPNGGYEI